MENTIADIDFLSLNERNRLRALRHYKLVNGLPNNYFARLAHSIADTFDTPIALISIVDKEHVSFPGNAGIPNIDGIPRHISLCSLALLNRQPTIFPDTLKEPSLSDNPLIAGDFGLRFYAGAPILTEDDQALGVVCIVDKHPRELSKNEIEILKSYADMAMQQIKHRLQSLH